MRLDKKVAIITGAASGIGKVIAQICAKEGAAVVIADCNPTTGLQTEKELNEQGYAATFIRGDVSNVREVQHIVQAAVHEFGALHILVNNAAWKEEVDAISLSEAGWNRTIDVCLKAVYLLSRYSIPFMQDEGGGSIINISSVNAIVTNPSLSAYSAAKAGMLGLTRNLALEYGKDNIRVNAICPGIIATAQFKDLIQQNSNEKWAAQEVHPIRRWGEPEDVAWAVVFLAADEAKFITGATIVVDGGLTIQSPEALVRPLFRHRWREGILVQQPEYVISNAEHH
jgi:NAD(P)-dependent dehydrogenase (short-subunit alcohol dehydrogenase family)